MYENLSENSPHVEAAVEPEGAQVQTFSLCQRNPPTSPQLALGSPHELASRAPTLRSHPVQQASPQTPLHYESEQQQASPEIGSDSERPEQDALPVACHNKPAQQHLPEKAVCGERLQPVMPQNTQQTDMGGEQVSGEPEEQTASLATGPCGQYVQVSPPPQTAACSQHMQLSVLQTALCDVDERVKRTALQTTVYNKHVLPQPVDTQAAACSSRAARQTTTWHSRVQPTVPLTTVYDVDERVRSSAPHIGMLDIDERVSQAQQPTRVCNRPLLLSTRRCAMNEGGAELVTPQPAVCIPDVPRTEIGGMPQTMHLSGKQQLPLLSACTITCNCERSKVTTSCCEKTITQSCCLAVVVFVVLYLITFKGNKYFSVAIENMNLFRFSVMEEDQFDPTKTMVLQNSYA